MADALVVLMDQKGSTYETTCSVHGVVGYSDFDGEWYGEDRRQHMSLWHPRRWERERHG